MSFPSLTGESLYGILEFLVYKRKKANSKFIMMRSPDQVGDDTRLGNSRFVLPFKLRGSGSKKLGSKIFLLCIRWVSDF